MQQQAHLITVEVLRRKGRPLGKVSNEQLEAYIEEVEQLYIKPTLGDKLFLDLLFKNYDGADSRYNTLLDGGTYREEEKECGCFKEARKEVENEEAEDEEAEDEMPPDTRYLTGLRTAISYFVYAQNIMTGDFQSTRYGMVMKENDYSSHLSNKDRSDAYNNALEVANNYLRECVQYCKKVGLIKTSRRSSYGSGSIRIRKIG